MLGKTLETWRTVKTRCFQTNWSANGSLDNAWLVSSPRRWGIAGGIALKIMALHGENIGQL